MFLPTFELGNKSERIRGVLVLEVGSFMLEVDTERFA
jgi:hypothetical protein